MTTKADEFIQSLEGDGDMSPEQAAQLLELTEEGDTGVDPSDDDGEPEAIPGDGDDDPEAAGATAGEQGGAEVPDPDSLNAENAVILAKDGKHTISYDKLVEAREAAKQAKADADAARAELEALQAKAQARADAGEAATEVDNQVAIAQEAIDAGVDPALFGDFSEAAMAKGIAQLSKMYADMIREEFRAEFAKALEPMQQREAKSAEDAHFGAIYDAHPDADSIIESQEFQGWRDSQPAFARQAIAAVLDKGSAAEVIEVFTTFKGATGQTQPATKPDPGAVRAKAQAVIDKTAAPVPASLSDFPGGRSGSGLTREEEMANLEGVDLLEAMENMAPDKIEDFLDRRL